MSFPLRPSERKTWCAEGSTFSDASDAIDLAAHERTRVQFARSGHDDRRAAGYLHAFTGLQPIWRDHGGLQGAADIELRAPDGSRHVVEVTSTIEGNHHSERLQTERLAVAVTDLYTGPFAWIMHFTQGWRAQWNQKALLKQAALIAAELAVLDSLDLRYAMLATNASIRVLRDLSKDMGVTVDGWSANIPDPDHDLYLDRLSRFLIESPLIARKRSKLVEEATVLGATRRHLYLLLAGSGANGALLPASPSYLTQGVFECPVEITDLWLDGGTGEIYHWENTTGWLLHRLWLDWLDEDRLPSPGSGAMV